MTSIGASFRCCVTEYELTRQQVLKLRGCEHLLDGESTVQRSIMLRNPYIDPMHLVQVDLLRRWRAGSREDREMLAALLASVSGHQPGAAGRVKRGYWRKEFLRGQLDCWQEGRTA